MSETTHKSHQGNLKRGPAWQAAEAAGLDMSLVEISLAKSPWQRLLDHDDALAFAEKLRAASKAIHAQSKQNPLPPA